MDHLQSSTPGSSDSAIAIEYSTELLDKINYTLKGARIVCELMYSISMACKIGLTTNDEKDRRMDLFCV